MISGGNSTDNWFIYLACGGDKSGNTGKLFKVGGNWEIEYKFINGLYLDITIPMSIWAQLSILYL